MSFEKANVWKVHFPIISNSVPIEFRNDNYKIINDSDGIISDKPQCHLMLKRKDIFICASGLNMFSCLDEDCHDENRLSFPE